MCTCRYSWCMELVCCMDGVWWMGTLVEFGVVVGAGIGAVA